MPTPGQVIEGSATIGRSTSREAAKFGYFFFGVEYLSAEGRGRRAWNKYEPARGLRAIRRRRRGLYSLNGRGGTWLGPTPSRHST